MSTKVETIEFEPQLIKVDANIDKNPNRMSNEVKRPLNIQDNIFDIIQNKAVEDYRTNLQEGKTEYNAIILRNNNSVAADLVGADIIVRARVPELHSHLPLPRSSQDARIIDMYPEYTAEGDDPKITDTNVGAMVRVNHRDKFQSSLRFENGYILESLNRSVALAAGFESLSWTCEGEPAPNGVKPETGEPLKGKNKSKTEGSKGVNRSKDTIPVEEFDRRLKEELERRAKQPEKAKVSTKPKKKSICAPKELLEKIAREGGFVAYSRGKPLGEVEVEFIKGASGPQGYGPGKNLHPIVTRTHKGVPFAKYFNIMQQHAAAAGVQLTPTSIFRTMSQQKDMKARKPTKAAKPGYSNHQSGIAIDIGSGGGQADSYQWLVQHAIKYGFVRTVIKETWHWEYRPGTKMFTWVWEDWTQGRTATYRRTQREERVTGKNGGWPPYILDGDGQLKEYFKKLHTGYARYELKYPADKPPKDVLSFKRSF